MNLLAETLEAITDQNLTHKDIHFIGSRRTGHSCDWGEFILLADIEYDAGYGTSEVAYDLIIVFNDGGFLSRWEYDGSEGWSYTPCFALPQELKPITRLTPAEREWGSSLEELNAN